MTEEYYNILYTILYSQKIDKKNDSKKLTENHTILYYNTIYYPLQSKIKKSSIFPSILHQFQIKDSES